MSLVPSLQQLSLAVLAFTVLTYRRLGVGSLGGSNYRGMDDDGAL